MMRTWVKVFSAAGLAMAVMVTGMAVTTQSALAGGHAVKERKAEMKVVAKANKAMKKAAKAGDAGTVKAQAAKIIASSDKLAGLFPKGTGRGTLSDKETRSKANIWTDWDTFVEKLNAMKSGAQKAAGGDMKAAASLGKTCGGCHKLFRGKKVKS